MKWLFAALSGMFLAVSVAAAEEPDQLVKSVTEEVLTIVRNDKDIQSGNARKAIALVDAKVLPHFNFTRMTQLAMGREWRNASPAQQQTLTTEFKTLLVRTYSKALTEYRNQTIEYKPFTAKAGDTEAKVKTLVKQQGSAKPIELDKLPKGKARRATEAEVAELRKLVAAANEKIEQARHRAENSRKEAQRAQQKTE